MTNPERTGWDSMSWIDRQFVKSYMGPTFEESVVNDPIVFAALKRMRNHPPNTPYAGTPSMLSRTVIPAAFVCDCCRVGRSSSCARTTSWPWWRN